LFSIGTINLLETIQFMETIDVEIMDIDVNISILEQGFWIQNIEKKIACKRYDGKVALKDKVYPKTYYNHQPGSVAVDET
jgi:hypothetical protein